MLFVVAAIKLGLFSFLCIFFLLIVFSNFAAIHKSILRKVVYKIHKTLSPATNPYHACLSTLQPGRQTCNHPTFHPQIHPQKTLQNIKHKPRQRLQSCLAHRSLPCHPPTHPTPPKNSSSSTSMDSSSTEPAIHCPPPSSTNPTQNSAASNSLHAPTCEPLCSGAYTTSMLPFGRRPHEKMQSYSHSSCLVQISAKQPPSCGARTSVAKQA